MIGSLLYLTASRPDIMFSVCMCARFQDNPKESHLSALKRILRYLKYAPSIGLWYPHGACFELLGYSDSDFTGCRVDRKSTSGGCHLLGRSLVAWSSKKQNSVALSTAETEYISAGACCAQILYMKQSLLDYGLVLDRVPLLCDNESVVKLLTTRFNIRAPSTSISVITYCEIMLLKETLSFVVFAPRSNWRIYSPSLLMKTPFVGFGVN
jgi:hypothetical protein